MSPYLSLEAEGEIKSEGQTCSTRYLMMVYIIEKRIEYSQQSKMENAFYWYTTLIERKLTAKTEKRRRVEDLLGCTMLNGFTERGDCQFKFIP